MPVDFVKMHRRFGSESRLITLYKNSLNFEEDICLGFELPKGKIAKSWRDSKIEAEAKPSLRYYKPTNLAERLFFKLRDLRNSRKIQPAIDEFGLYDFDIYHFDGGMDLYRDSRFALELKKRGKKIVCCYFGSDLRTRGIIRELDEISDLNITVEYDHLALYKGIGYVFFPFDTSGYVPRQRKNPKLKIIHSPTNRKFKGTDKIINVIAEVESVRQIEFILLENMDRAKVLEIKQTCDLAIDQVGGEQGGSGYGKNSIENLSMGIPTLTEFDADYFHFLGKNPFVNTTIETLKENLLALIDNEELRIRLSQEGRKWVEETHSFEAVNKMLMGYYRKSGILQDD